MSARTLAAAAPARSRAPVRRIGWIAALAALACAGSWAVVLRGGTPSVLGPGPEAGTGAAAGPGPLPRVHAIGRLEPAGTVLRLAAPTAVDGSRVERLLVAEGDAVAAGDIVAVLDTAARRQAAVEEAEARAEAARARRDQIRAGPKVADLAAQAAAVARADAALHNAGRDLRRTEALLRRGVASAEAMDEARLAWDSARLEADRARAVLDGLSEVRAVDIRQQEREIRAAEAAVARARADLDASCVKAPAAGRVLKLHARAGERIGDRGLLELGATHEMHAVAEVYEADVPRVRVGLPARVRLVSSDVELDGRVEQVGLLVGRKVVLDNDPVSDTDARVVEVRVRLDPDAGRSVAGLSNARVGVTILVE